MTSHGSTVSFHWRWVLALWLYRLLAPILLCLALPSWWKKMLRRGGWSTPIAERFGRYHEDAEWAPCGRPHIHAVSVGETLIALKLIQQWQANSNVRVTLAVSTATAYQLASSHASENLTVVYAPLDLSIFVSSYLKRFEPSQVILIEAEVWPEMMQQCKNRRIPVCVVNARLSHSSEKLLKRFWSWISPMYLMIDRFGVQGKEDAMRFFSLGINEGSICITGSIKFDPIAATEPQKRREFESILKPIAKDRRIILAASTHDGEELFIAKALEQTPYFLVLVPRHAERSTEVIDSLRSAKRKPWLRSQGIPPCDLNFDCLVIDSTGELRDWTAHADLVVIGKSFLAVGGQNPAEAILAGVPVITGPHMENFEPLHTQLQEKCGVCQVSSASEMALKVETLMRDSAECQAMCQRAREVLQQHQNATVRSIELIELKMGIHR